MGDAMRHHREPTKCREPFASFALFAVRNIPAEKFHATMGATGATVRASRPGA